MDNNFNIGIDFEAIMKMAIDKALIETMSSLMPDDKTRKLMLGILNIHRKYGIDAVTSIKIIQDIAEFTKEDNDGGNL